MRAGVRHSNLHPHTSQHALPPLAGPPARFPASQTRASPHVCLPTSHLALDQAIQCKTNSNNSCGTRASYTHVCKLTGSSAPKMWGVELPVSCGAETKNHWGKVTASFFSSSSSNQTRKFDCYLIAHGWQQFLPVLKEVHVMPGESVGEKKQTLHEANLKMRLIIRWKWGILHEVRIRKNVSI